MNVLIIGEFPESSKKNIVGLFPDTWRIQIAAPEDSVRFLKDAEVVIPEHVRIDAPFLDQAPKLRLVQTGAGYDNVDIGECTKRGVRVCNASGVNAVAVAEHVMALLLGFYKNIPYLDSFMKSRRSEKDLDYAGGELYGKTIGIVGTGNIGRKVASYSRAFGMHVLGYHHRGIASPEMEMVGWNELFRRSDIVSVHLPLSAETRGRIGSAEFENMKRTALLINTSRGAVIDENALIRSLKNGEIAGACLDVYTEEPLASDSPLRDMENVILTPHTAGLPDGVKFHINRYRFFISNIEKVMAGEQPEHALNTV